MLGNSREVETGVGNDIVGLNLPCIDSSMPENWPDIVEDIAGSVIACIESPMLTSSDIQYIVCGA